MIITILILQYLLGIVLIRYGYRLKSSKHNGEWLDEDCRADLFWFIPIFNLIIGIIFTLEGLLRDRELRKSKWLNTDL